MLGIPHFKLTHGQVAWAICQGRKPDPQTMDALRYLRQLGVPFTNDELGSGSGNRIYYTFDHLIECSIAVFAIRRGMKPKLAAEYLTGDRVTLRKLYRSKFRAQPEAALDADWVKSRGRILPGFASDTPLRLHDRFRQEGRIEPMTPDERVSFNANLGDLVERYDNRVFVLVPLERVMLETVAWALEAPITRPGRIPRHTKLVARARED